MGTTKTIVKKNIFPPITQRRDVQLNDVQTIKKVFAKTAFLNLFL